MKKMTMFNPVLPRVARTGSWLVVLFLAGCATGIRDDLKFRQDINDLNLGNLPIEAARTRLAERGFACEKGYERYANSPLRSVDCTRPVAGLACRDIQRVTLEYRVESGLVDRVATGSTNGCN